MDSDTVLKQIIQYTANVANEREANTLALSPSDCSSSSAFSPSSSTSHYDDHKNKNNSRVIKLTKSQSLSSFTPLFLPYFRLALWSNVQHPHNNNKLIVYFQTQKYS